MIKRSSFIVFIFIFITQVVYADFDFNTNCINAYKNILSLKLNLAQLQINAEKRKNPDNAIPYLLDNYLDYFTFFVNGTEADFEKLKANKSFRLSRIEKEDPRSPYYLYAQAEINMQNALVRSRFNEYLTSAIEISRAFKQLEENSKRFPGFLPNQKNLGMIHSVLGSVPEGLKKALSVFGIRVNAAKGMHMLESLILTLPQSAYSHYYDETAFYLANIRTDIIHDSFSYDKIIEDTNLIEPESLLRTYIRAYVGVKMGHPREAIEELAKKPSGVLYPLYPDLDYLAGMAKIHSLDYSASSHFISFLKNYRGINFIKDAYLNLAWLELLKGNVRGYQSFTEQLKRKGYSYHDKDMQAIHEANDPMPNPGLLKARLLFDGAYYDKALAQIVEIKVSTLVILRDKIEYYYRTGRIYDEISKDNLALKYYQSAIDMGINERYYFASTAALKMAGIYEKRKDFQKAKTYFNIAINMRRHDYESSVENRAKQGLKRIEE